MLLSTKKRKMPVGLVKPFGCSNIPGGWLPCNGSVVLQSDYVNLYNTIGTTFNTGGEGVNEFRLPDLRGEFIRCLDSGKGVDPNRTLGSSQGSSFGEHAHLAGTLTASTVPGAHSHTLTVNAATAPHSHTVGTIARTPKVGQAGPTSRRSPGPVGPFTPFTASATAPHSHSYISPPGTATHAHTTPELAGALGATGGPSTPTGAWPGAAVGANETRPRNIAVNFGIKF